MKAAAGKNGSFCYIELIYAAQVCGWWKSVKKAW